MRCYGKIPHFHGAPDKGCSLWIVDVKGVSATAGTRDADASLTWTHPRSLTKDLGRFGNYKAGGEVKPVIAGFSWHTDLGDLVLPPFPEEDATPRDLRQERSTTSSNCRPRQTESLLQSSVLRPSRSTVEIPSGYLVCDARRGPIGEGMEPPSLPRACLPVHSANPGPSRTGSPPESLCANGDGTSKAKVTGPEHPARACRCDSRR
jgi:hypothetical protein